MFSDRLKKRIYNSVKIAAGASALVLSVEYVFYMIRWPKQTYFYVGDIIIFLLFGTFMLGEAFIALIEKPKQI